MSIFRYKALTETGKKISGVIDADSLDLAKEKLRREKVLVTKLDAIEKNKEVVMKSDFLLAFTREMGQLLKAGLPLYESLLTIEEKYRKSSSHPLLVDLCDQLKKGEQLSSILKNYPKSFDPIYRALIQAGEKTGSLAWAFEQLFALIERKQKLRKQLISAMAYPSFLGGFCFLVVMGLLLFVIPSMQDLFEGRSLHPLTQMILGISNFLQRRIVMLLATLLSLTLGSVYFFRDERGRNLLHRTLLKLPLIKTILTHAALLRFCRSLSVLLSGGVPLVSALTISRGIMRHAHLEEAIGMAEKHLIEGKPFSQILKKSSHIPPLVSRMIAIAEETGKLPEMLRSLSDIYDNELERNLAHITTFLQPALLIVLGGVIGLVILSILLPLTDVSSLIST